MRILEPSQNVLSDLPFGRYPAASLKDYTKSRKFCTTVRTQSPCACLSSRVLIELATSAVLEQFDAHAVWLLWSSVFPCSQKTGRPGPSQGDQLLVRPCSVALAS